MVRPLYCRPLGLESNFGRIQGGYPVISALVMLAFDGRRGFVQTPTVGRVRHFTRWPC